ncbi:MAG: hypothetical protein AB7R89_18400 [Dehalococcoidia bacterium]
MKVAQLLVLSLGCVVSACGGGDRDEVRRTDDGRYGTECIHRRVTGMEPADEAPVCVVPYARLLARPEDFHNRHIRIAGYVAATVAGPVLAPSLESVRMSLWYEEVELGRDFEAFKNELANDEVCGPVFINGLFDAKSQLEGGRTYLGALKNPSPIFDPLTREEREREGRPICVPLRAATPEMDRSTLGAADSR